MAFCIRSGGFPLPFCHQVLLGDKTSMALWLSVLSLALSCLLTDLLAILQTWSSFRALAFALPSS